MGNMGYMCKVEPSLHHTIILPCHNSLVLNYAYRLEYFPNYNHFIIGVIEITTRLKSLILDSELSIEDWIPNLIYLALKPSAE